MTSLNSQKSGLSFINETLNSPEENAALHVALRPESFNSFTGQPKTIERLRVMVGASKKRQEPLKHILLSGPPGLGKTSLALMLGKEMETKVRISSGPIIEKASDLAGILTNLEANDILFIDEIHRIPRTVEEYLYSAMEDFHIDIMIDQGPNARSIRLNIPQFTLVGATTRMGLLTAPLRSRFTLQTRLDHYTPKELAEIILRSCRLLNVEIETGGAEEIARRARGTPRIANNLIYFARDFAIERANGVIDTQTASKALDLLDIDKFGLDEVDKRILTFIAENFSGGPVGLNTIAAAINEENDTIEEVHEPYLIQEGYLQRTSQGRVLTAKAYDVLGLKKLAAFDQLGFTKIH